MYQGQDRGRVHAQAPPPFEPYGGAPTERHCRKLVLKEVHAHLPSIPSTNITGLLLQGLWNGVDGETLAWLTGLTALRKLDLRCWENGEVLASLGLLPIEEFVSTQGRCCGHQVSSLLAMKYTVHYKRVNVWRHKRYF